MRKGEFDLTGKAVDCSGLPVLGDAGKEIFRALSVAIGFDGDKTINYLDVRFPFIKLFFEDVSLSTGAGKDKTIQPSDVLGQSAIDAAMDGATIVFEGDRIPNLNKFVYYSSGHISLPFISGGAAPSSIIAYKILDEKPSKNDGFEVDESEFSEMIEDKTDYGKTISFVEAPKTPSIESRILAEKVNTSTAYKLDKESMTATRSPENDFIVNTKLNKHSHYFKDVSDLDEVDVYRVCDLFEVNDASGAKQHAIKKLLCSGQRGAKDERKDLEEARDAIIRKLAMMSEDNQ